LQERFAEQRVARFGDTIIQTFGWKKKVVTTKNRKGANAGGELKADHGRTKEKSGGDGR